MSEKQNIEAYKFSFTTPTVASPKVVYPDERTWVEKMFEDYDPTTGKKTTLPVEAIDVSEYNVLGDIEKILPQNSLPILLCFGEAVEGFAGYRGLKASEPILVLGGMRKGKAGQGRMFLPLSEVSDFCDRVAALAEAAEQTIPNLLTQLEARKKEQNS